VRGIGWIDMNLATQLFKQEFQSFTISNEREVAYYSWLLQYVLNYICIT